MCLKSNGLNVKILIVCHVVDSTDKSRQNLLPDICGQAKSFEINLNSSLKTKKNYIFIDHLAYLLEVIGPYGNFL